MKDLNYIVNSVLADLEMPQSRHYMKFMKWAIDGYRRMNLSGQMPTIKSIMVDIDKATNTVLLPDDYIHYTKIGLCCGDTILNYALDPDLRVPEVELCGCDELADCQTQCYQGTYNNYLGWGYYGFTGIGTGNAGFPLPLYGLGAGFAYGTFNIKNNVLYLGNAVIADKVVIEYRSNGLPEDGNAAIPESAIPPLTAYVHWQKVLNSTNIQDKQMIGIRERRWDNEYKGYVRRQQAMTAFEWKQLIRKHVYQTVKR